VLEFISDLGQFVRAVINSWAGYATGGVIVALLWLWSTWKQVSVPRTIGIGLASFFLFLAIFNAWRTEYKLRRSFEEMRLSGYLDTVWIAPAGTHGQSAIVTVHGIVVNPTGPPTVAVGWGMSARLKDGRSVRGRQILQSGDLKLADPNNPTIVLKVTDYWPEATVSQPIPTGGAKMGWINGIFQDATQQELHDESTVITVSLQDVRGKQYSLEIKRGSLTRFIDPRSLQPENK
jgi:hypothetical protein